MTQELLKQEASRLVLAVVDAGYPWTEAMLDAYSKLAPLLKLNLEVNYYCVYCGTPHSSDSGTGSDISCCGEVGHVIAQLEPTKLVNHAY